MQDVHTHFVPADVVTWMKDNKQTVRAKWEKKDPQKEEFLVINDKWGFELKKEFIDPSLYLKKQAEAGVFHSLISPIPQLFLYDFQAEITAELSTVYNNGLSEWMQKNEKELSALAMVPLNDPEKAAAELKRSMDLGLRGAIVGPGCNGSMLTEDFFTPFWEEANRQKAIIFLHPLLNEDPRLKKKKMPNLIGVPWETTVAATDILLNRLLDQFPDVKILLAHGGGFLPYQIGRLNQGYEKWGQVSESLTEPIDHYLKRFWYDTVLWNSETLNYLASVVGEDRVVPGSDFPFDLSVWPPHSLNEKGIESLFR
ncbi:MAG TPA: amidohydrolase family protein [Bacillales bacterium]|nr:amidohydrolase family protein [Bacillales bacterium]